MKIAITGANEFVGAYLCRYFHAAGHEVLALAKPNDPAPTLLQFASYKQTDILKPFDILDADVCIHADNYHLETADYHELFLNHVEGTLNVVEAAQNCSFLIHLSSSSVYQFGDQPVSETDATIESNLSEYGETKLLAEEVLTYDIPVNQKRLILRPRAIYGVGDTLFLPRLFNLLKGHTIFCTVDRKVKTSLTHVENIAYAIELFLHQKDGENLQIYNVTDDEEYPICESIVELLSVIEGRQLELINIPSTALNAIDRIYSKLTFLKQLNPALFQSIHKNSVLNLNCIRKNLVYKPPRNLHNSINEIARWIKYVGGKKAYNAQLSAAPWMVNF